MVGPPDPQHPLQKWSFTSVPQRKTTQARPVMCCAVRSWSAARPITAGIPRPWRPGSDLKTLLPRGALIVTPGIQLAGASSNDQARCHPGVCVPGRGNARCRWPLHHASIQPACSLCLSHGRHGGGRWRLTGRRRYAEQFLPLLCWRRRCRQEQTAQRHGVGPPRRCPPCWRNCMSRGLGALRGPNTAP